MKALVYDLEIINAIPNKKEPPIPDINYCNGWHDHAGMGISVLCAYDFHERRYRVFTESNKTEFFNLTNDRLLVTFNGLAFDDPVITTCWGAKANYPEGAGILEHLAENHYDILVELWRAHGLPPTFSYPTHIGFSLDEVAYQNFGSRKSGHGALAPIQWQRGQLGDVIDYCLQDVRLTAQLFAKIVNEGSLLSPKNPGQTVVMPALETFPSELPMP